MCSEVSDTANKSDLVFTASTKSNDNNCRCEIENNIIDQDLILSIIFVDLRLSIPVSTNESVAQCSSATFSYGNNTIECDPTKGKDDIVNFKYNAEEVIQLGANSSLEVSLQGLYINGTDDLPGSIWMQITGIAL